MGILGIIGGNGVVATNRLLQLVEELFTKNGAYRDVHHPEMIVWQATQAPSRSMFLEGLGESFIPDYVRIGRQLKLCGCTELCMCCNTAHYAVDELQAKIELPFINIIELVAKKCDQLGCKKVLVLCTAGLRKYGLYEKSFTCYASQTRVIYPSDEFQLLVTKGICNAKSKVRFENENLEKEHPKNYFQKVCDYYSMNEGVDCIVGGCTDISNVFFYNNSKVRYVDSLQTLAEAIFLKYSKAF